MPESPRQFRLPFARPSDPRAPLVIVVRKKTLVASIVRDRRARRYLLRVRPDGTLRLTIPPRGSFEDARRFVVASYGWIERERLRYARQARRSEAWRDGTEILLRGERTVLRVTSDGRHDFVAVGEERLRVPGGAADLRPHVETLLRRRASRELVARLEDLAARHDLTVTRAIVRDQRTRWGSCSPTGEIRLNWRLIQMPPHVRDYVLLHELMHLRVQSHSRRFWQLVERVSPDHKAARRWLREHGETLW